MTEKNSSRGSSGPAAKRRRRKRSEAERIARETMKRLAALGVTPGMDRPSDIGDLAWSNTLQRLTGEVTHDVADEFRQRRLGQPVPDFTPLSPDEVAGPVDVQTWMVRGLWALGSHGSMAGPKKSLKTTFHDAMAIGIACGKPVLDEWEVAERGPVLIYAGEGSVEWRKKSLQRLANDLYNVKIGTGEDQAQIHVVPVSYPFNTSEFRLGLAKNMRDINPVMVTLDSTYNYHPRGINTADMYDRGPLFAELSALVRDCDPLTSLVLIDHMRQNASLDLDAINMAGVGQWVDSWILCIVDQGNPEAGTFKVDMEIASRRWGGRRKTVDWNLGQFNLETDDWSQAISAEVSDMDWGGRQGRGESQIDTRIIETIRADEWLLTKAQVVDAVGSNNARVRERIDALVSQKIICVESRPRPEGAREVTRPVYGTATDTKIKAPAAEATRADRKKRVNSGRKKGRG